MTYNYRTLHVGVTSLAITLGILVIQPAPARSIQLADGQTYFTQIPRLDKVEATFDSARFPRSIYYFTVAIPEDAGEPLQRITFRQKRGFEQVDFNLKKTVAYEEPNRKRVIPLKNISANTQEGDLR